MGEKHTTPKRGACPLQAALNGNEKLEFGIQWQEVLFELQASMCEAGVDNPSEDDLRTTFDEIDTSGDGATTPRGRARHVAVPQSRLAASVSQTRTTAAARRRRAQ